MKIYIFSLLIVLFVGTVVSCAKAGSGSAEGMINPGDKIGNFLVTRGGEEGVTYTWNLDQECVKQGGVEIYSCKVDLDTNVNVSWGVYAPRGEDLDTLWSEYTYKMFINDRPVNLEDFASITVYHPQVGKMRHWNVVIVANKPGDIIVHSIGILRGETSEDTTTYTFSSP